MKKIYINPGHSNTDPGAVGYATERVLNVKVSEYMKKYLLDNYECEIRMNPGTMDKLSEICADANNWKADLFVSNHFNAAGGDGFEAYVYSQNRLVLGEIFAKYVKEAGQNLRYPDKTGNPMGVKIRNGLYVLKYTNMPAILNEGAFVDNKKDITDWDEDHELQKLGEAYAKAAAEFLSLPKISKPAPKPQPAPTSVVKPEAKPTYTHEQFVRDVQKAIGATVDGKAGPETISKTPTIGATKNNKHTVILPVQKKLQALGYTEVGTPDGAAGPKFKAAMEKFQSKNGCYADGEAQEWSKTWHKLLEM